MSDEKLDETTERLIEDLVEARDTYRGQLKHLAALCGMASARLCEPVSRKDIAFAKESVEVGIHVMHQLVREEAADTLNAMVPALRQRIRTLVEEARMRELEAGILRELKEVTGNRKLRQKDIQEWSTGSIKQQGEEQVAYLPLNKVNVAYLESPR